MTSKKMRKELYVYFLLLSLTIMFGILFVYSSLFALQSTKEIINIDAKFKKHLLALFLGFVGAIFCFVFGNYMIRKKRVIIFIYFFLLFMLTITLFLPKIGGVNRWMTVGGFQFQTSELAKLILPAIIAFYYSKIRKKNGNFLLNIILPSIILLLPVFLIFKEPDLSTSFIISIIVLTGMILSIKNKESLISLFVLIAIIILLVFSFKDTIFKSYQLDRINKSDNYQTNQSITAIKNGGLFGTSPFNGTKKYFVPESYSDFIMSVIGEEWGKFGIILVISIFFFLSHELIKLSYFTKDFITFIYCSLTAVWIFLQTIINSFVGLGVKWFPVTGVTLPLLSYGNSSIIITLTSIGFSLGLIYHQITLLEGEKNNINE